MKPPGWPGPISTKTGSRQVKSTVLIAVGPRPSDQVGLGVLTATGEVEGAGDPLFAGEASGPVHAETTAIKARPASLIPGATRRA